MEYVEHKLDEQTDSRARAYKFFFVLFDSLRPLNNLSVMRDGLPGLNQY